MSYARPQDRPPAPAPLDRVQEFVNTRTNVRETGDFSDEFSAPTALRDWLSSRELLAKSARVAREDLERAIVVREGLRALFAHHNDASVEGDADALRALDEVAATLPLRVSAVDALTLIPVAEPGIGRALAILLANTVGTPAEILTRLKTCRDPACRWAFYDWSKNRSGAWCAMASCGAAAKKRQFTERRRQRRHK